CDQSAIAEIDDIGAPTAQELLRQPIAPVLGLDISLHQRTASAIGLQVAHILGATGMRLEEKRVQRLEAGRFAEFVGCAEDIHPVANALDRDASSAKAADIVQSQG